jgi:hypothetical protein
MCIFCGGTCGGGGDIILPYAAIGISLVTLKIQAVRASRKQKAEDKKADKADSTQDSD